MQLVRVVRLMEQKGKWASGKGEESRIEREGERGRRRGGTTSEADPVLSFPLFANRVCVRVRHFAYLTAS